MFRQLPLLFGAFWRAVLRCSLHCFAASESPDGVRERYHNPHDENRPSSRKQPNLFTTIAFETPTFQSSSRSVMIRRIGTIGEELVLMIFAAGSSVSQHAGTYLCTTDVITNSGTPPYRALLSSSRATSRRSSIPKILNGVCNSRSDGNHTQP